MRQIAIIGLAVLLSACSSNTKISATDPDVVIKINTQEPVRIGDGVSRKLRDTSFGQYNFKASSEDGKAMFGIVPLQFRGGALAMDVLFFAPAAFFNLRGLFPYYEFDTERGVVKYKNKQGDAWREYTPKAAEVERAKQYFGE